MDASEALQLLEEALIDVPWSKSLPPSAYHYADGLPPITEAAKEDTRVAFRGLEKAGKLQDNIDRVMAENPGRGREALIEGIQRHANMRALMRTLEVARACRG